MSKFTFWADLFKFSDDVINEDYGFDNNYSVKVKAKSQCGHGDYSLKFEQSKPNEDGESTNAIELKQKISRCWYEMENKIKSGGKVSTEVTFNLSKVDENFKGWYYILNANLVNGSTLDKSNFSSAFKFKRDNAEVKVTVPHGTPTEVDAEFAFKPDQDHSLIVGGTGSFSLKSTSVKKYEFGVLGRLDDHLSWGLKNWSTDGKTYGNFSAHTLHNINDKTDVASKVTYSLGSKSIAATTGFVHRFCDDWTWKARVNTDGQFATSSKYKIGSSTHVTLSTALDLGTKSISHSSPHPFGIALESKF